MDFMKPYTPEESIQLRACPHCGRTFNSSAFEKHVSICDKLAKKRRIFDSSRQRREGTALSEYAVPSVTESPIDIPINVEPPKLVAKKPDTEDVKISVLDNTSAPKETIPKEKPGIKPTVIPATVECKPRPKMKSAADGEKPSLVGSNPKKTTTANAVSKLQECQYCHRTFNAKAYDNHVKWCQEKSVEALFQKQTSETNAKAMERMKARMQYKPPVPKSKRAKDPAAN